MMTQPVMITLTNSKDTSAKMQFMQAKINDLTKQNIKQQVIIDKNNQTLKKVEQVMSQINMTNKKK